MEGRSLSSQRGTEGGQRTGPERMSRIQYLNEVRGVHASASRNQDVPLRQPSAAKGIMPELGRLVGNQALIRLFRDSEVDGCRNVGERTRLEREAERQSGQIPEEWSTRAGLAVPFGRDGLSGSRVAGPAQPLSEPVRSLFERHLGRSLGDVTLHSDRQSGRVAEAIHAKAFTIGETIYFTPLTHVRENAPGLRLLAHELIHVKQQKVGRAPYSIQLNSRAREVEDHLGFFDSGEDAVAAVSLLGSMNTADFNDTIAAMARSGSIARLVHRLPSRSEVVRFLHMLADRGTRVNQEAVFVAIPFLNLSAENHLIVFGRRQVVNLGARGPAPAPGLAGSLVSASPSAPFTGGGARGTLAADAPMSLTEMWNLRSQAREAVERFGPGGVEHAQYTREPGLEMLYDWSNPNKGNLVGPGSYLGGVGAAERVGQVQLLFGQDIATSFGGAYAGAIPSRIQVVRAAATAHNLEPELVAGIILAEQRDQSLREDAADFRGASLAGRSTSIGLGQVTVTTARRENLFADLVSPEMQTLLTSNPRFSGSMIPALLASDEFNIFAVARYLRIVATLGSTKSAGSLPRTVAWAGPIDFSKYAGHSSTWTDAHVRVIGSEYTSRPFDDLLVEGWGDFVLEAYRDVKAAGIF